SLPSRRPVHMGAGGLATVRFRRACAGAGTGGEGDAVTEPHEDSAAMQEAVQQVITAGIPVGEAEFLQEHGVVVTHPSDDDYRVFSTVCPHQNGTVDAVDQGSGRLVCRIHGSQFDPITGEVVVGPSAEGLLAKDIDIEPATPSS
ncbi:MAG: Rieske (2Fe-2S) protein, partial [Mobilicoccus sp.]|nr:Rieske (2Fe-2S) protein [Mobilicoccus sp.]